MNENKNIKGFFILISYVLIYQLISVVVQFIILFTIWKFTLFTMERLSSVSNFFHPGYFITFLGTFLIGSSGFAVMGLSYFYKTYKPSKSTHFTSVMLYSLFFIISLFLYHSLMSTTLIVCTIISFVIIILVNLVLTSLDIKSILY